jgi:hypothetical protein
MNCTTKLKEIQRIDPDDIAFVVIPSKGQIFRKDRRSIEAAAFVQFAVAADEGGGTKPTSFDQPTLRWALRIADAVVIWSGEYPTLAPTLKAARAVIHEFLAPFGVPGGRVAIVNVLDDHVDEWLEYVRTECHPNIPIRCLLTPSTEAGQC